MSNWEQYLSKFGLITISVLIGYYSVVDGLHERSCSLELKPNFKSSKTLPQSSYSCSIFAINSAYLNCRLCVLFTFPVKESINCL